MIIGLTDLLCRDTDNERQRRKFEQLSESSQHLLEIVNDILDISKIEAGQLALDRTEFQLGTILERVFLLLRDQALAKGLDFTLEIADDLRNLQVEGDPLRLSQVLINLCNNSIKFTTQGEVMIHVSSVADDGATVTLAFNIIDTGCGIELADQARLFQPFTQIDASLTRVQGGTGLGLAISQHLVQLMGSEITVNSTYGVGSTFGFRIRMPRATHAIQYCSPATVLPESLSFSGKRILIADDHSLSQEILLEMLERLGCDADIAVDGQDAFECAQARNYDLVLMDMQMPRVDGLAATRMIRQLSSYSKTPIIALTANAFAEDRKRCLEAGMDGHIGKPLTLARLAALLRLWLSDAPVAQAVSPPDVEATPLYTALMNLPGLDIDPSWCASPQRAPAYRALLERFVRTNKADVQRIVQHLEAGDVLAARTLAHNVKGIAALVGAQRIAQLASDLEHRCKIDANTPPDLAVVDDLCHELEKLEEAVRSLP